METHGKGNYVEKSDDNHLHRWYAQFLESKAEAWLVRSPQGVGWFTATFGCWYPRVRCWGNHLGSTGANTISVLSCRRFFTFPNANMEPEHLLFEKEIHLLNLNFWVPGWF